MERISQTESDILQHIKETEAYWQKHGGYKSLEIVPFNDEQKLQFHNYMKNLAQKLLGEGINLDDENLVFVLSEDKSPNAAFVPDKNENYSFIYVSTGLFDLCENKDQFAFVLGHELQHFLEQKKHPDKTNSKLEETYADLNAVPKVARAGLNIRQAGVIAKKIFDRKIVNLAGVVDEHGLDVTRVKSIDMTILATKNYLSQKGITSAEIIGDETHPFDGDIINLLESRPKQINLRDFFNSDAYLNASYNDKIKMWFEKVNSALYLETINKETVYNIDELDKKILREERLKLYASLGRKIFDKSYDYTFEKTYLSTIYEDAANPKLMDSKGRVLRGLSVVPELGSCVGRFDFSDIGPFVRKYFEGFREAKDDNEALSYYTKLLVLSHAAQDFLFEDFCFNGNLFYLEHTKEDIGKTFSKAVLENHSVVSNPLDYYFKVKRVGDDIILHEGDVYMGINKEGKIKFVETDLDKMEGRFIAEQINDIVHTLNDIRNGKDIDSETKMDTLVKAWRLCMPARLGEPDRFYNGVLVSEAFMNFIQLDRFENRGGTDITNVERYLSDEAKQFWNEKEDYLHAPQNSWVEYITDTLAEEIRHTDNNSAVSLLFQHIRNYQNVVEVYTDQCEKLLKAQLESHPESSLVKTMRSITDMQLLHHLEAGKTLDEFQFPFEDICRDRYEKAQISGDLASDSLSAFYGYEMLKENPNVDLGQVYARNKEEVNSFLTSFSVLRFLSLPEDWNEHSKSFVKHDYGQFSEQLLQRYKHNIDNPDNWGDGQSNPHGLDMPFAERFYHLVDDVKNGMHMYSLDAHYYGDIALHFYQKASVEDKIKFMIPALGCTVPNTETRTEAWQKIWQVVGPDFKNPEFSFQQKLDMFCAMYQNNLFANDYKNYFEVLVGSDGKGGLLKEIEQQPAPRSQFYLKLLQKENRIVDPNIRQEVVNRACQSWFEEHGSYNDITAAPEEREQFIKDVHEIKEILKGKEPFKGGDEFFDEFLGKDREGAVPENDMRQFLSVLAEKTLSQPEVCYAIEPEPQELNTQDKKLIATAYGIDGLTYLLENNAINREKTIEFFLGDGSLQNAASFSSSIRSDLGNYLYSAMGMNEKIVHSYEGKLSPESLLMMKREFDAAPLEVKAAMINMLTSGNDWERNFNQVADKLFADSGELGKIGKKFLKSYIGSRDESERCFYLSAIYTAASNKSTVAFDDKTSPYTPEQRSLAQGLRLFLENSGPAGIKLAQAMSSYSEVPDFIRDEMQKAKNSANPPARWSVYRWLKDSKQMNLLEEGKLGKQLGSASFFVTYTMLGEDERKKVVKIMRGGAKFAADEEFKIYKNMMKQMQQEFGWLSSFNRLVDNAASMVDVETDLNIGKKQLDHAKTLYPDKAQGEDVTFRLNVMDWNKYDEIWAVMDLAEGKDFKDLSYPYKKKVAKAIFTTELANMLSGQRFDADRHAGQYKIDQSSNTIGVFDTGSVSVVEPTDKEKEVLGRVLANTVIKLMNTNDGNAASILCGEIDKSIEEHYAKEIKSGEQVPPYLSEFQRGLLALTDFHKEIPPKELAVCMMQALNNGKHKLDKVIYKGFAAVLFDNKSEKMRGSTQNAAEMVGKILSQGDKPDVMTEDAKYAQNCGRQALKTIFDNGGIYGAVTHIPDLLKSEKLVDTLKTSGGQIQFAKGMMRGLYDTINPNNYSPAEKQQVGKLLYQVVKQISVKKKLHQPYSALEIFENAAKKEPDLGKYAQNMAVAAGLAMKFKVDIEAAYFEKGVILGQLLDKDVEKGYHAALAADGDNSLLKKALSKVNPLKFVPRQYARRVVKYVMKQMAPKCAEMIKQQVAETNHTKEVGKGVQR